MKTLLTLALLLASATGIFAQGNGYTSSDFQYAYNSCMSNVLYAQNDRARIIENSVPTSGKWWQQAITGASIQVAANYGSSKQIAYCQQLAMMAAQSMVRANDQYDRRETLKIVSENQIGNTKETTERMRMLIDARLRAIHECGNCNIDEARRLADAAAPPVIGGNVFTEVDDSAFRAGKIDVNGRPIGQAAALAPVQNRSNIGSNPAASQPRIVGSSN